MDPDFADEGRLFLISRAVQLETAINERLFIIDWDAFVDGFALLDKIFDCEHCGLFGLF